MSPLVALRRSCLTVCLSLLAVCARAQTAAETKPYEPHVGQPGKDVIWVPTGNVLVEKMLDMAKVTPQDFVIDLGSGDGRTVIAAARRGARALGVEFNGDLVELSKRTAASEGVGDRAAFVQGDLFQTDLSEATVITMFLLTEINLKLRPTLLDLKPGTRIVSNSFMMGDWEPDDTASVEGDCANWCIAHFWWIPAKVAGRWGFSGVGELVLEQQFQKLSGRLGSQVIADGKLRGAEITFTVGDAKYTGQVKGTSIEGTVVSNGSSRPWTATRIGP